MHFPTSVLRKFVAPLRQSCRKKFFSGVYIFKFQFFYYNTKIISDLGIFLLGLCAILIKSPEYIVKVLYNGCGTPLYTCIQCLERYLQY